MTRALAFQFGIAGVAAISGVTLLVRARRAASAPVRQGQLIAGMMALALALFLGGFALVFSLAGAL